MFNWKPEKALRTFSTHAVILRICEAEMGSGDYRFSSQLGQVFSFDIGLWSMHGLVPESLVLFLCAVQVGGSLESPSSSLPASL